MQRLLCLLMSMVVLWGCAVRSNMTTSSVADPSLQHVVYHPWWSCEEDQASGDPRTTNYCYIIPINTAYGDLSTSQGRAALVQRLYKYTCRRIEILSDTSVIVGGGMSDPEHEARRVGLKCTH